MALSSSMQTKPHVPTLVWAILVVVAAILIYHVAAGRRRRG